MRMYFPNQITIPRKILFSFFVPFLIFYMFQSPVYAGWNNYKKTEIRNKIGHLLRFDTQNGRAVRLWLILKKGEKGVFSGRLPVYQIDNNKICRIKEMDPKYKLLKFKKNQWIRWQISDNISPSDRLLEFMNGKEVVFQYYRNDGKIMETVFPLIGAKKAIQGIMQ